jgi:hypothetical protein
VKVLRIDTWRMSERTHVGGNQKIEGLNAVGVGLAVIQIRKRFEYRWAANGNSPDRRGCFETQWSGRAAQDSQNDALPNLRDPVTIITFRVDWV